MMGYKQIIHSNSKIVMKIKSYIIKLIKIVNKCNNKIVS